MSLPSQMVDVKRKDPSARRRRAMSIEVQQFNLRLEFEDLYEMGKFWIDIAKLVDYYELDGPRVGERALQAAVSELAASLGEEVA